MKNTRKEALINDIAETAERLDAVLGNRAPAPHEPQPPVNKAKLYAPGDPCPKEGCNGKLYFEKGQWATYWEPGTPDELWCGLCDEEVNRGQWDTVAIYGEDFDPGIL